MNLWICLKIEKRQFQLLRCGFRGERDRDGLSVSHSSTDKKCYSA